MPVQPTTHTYLPRVADAMLRDQLSVMGAVLIEGPKSSGKTATARQLSQSEVLLDQDPEAHAKAQLDPHLILDGPTPRLLDEWQRAPRIWDAVRRAVDARGQAQQFILTGSATPDDHVQRHTGAGRFGVLRMRTMTLFEKQAAPGGISFADLLRGGPVAPANCDLHVADYLHHVRVGGWPTLVGASESAASTYLSGYLKTIIERDLPEATGTRRRPVLVRRFLGAYAQMTSQLATNRAIARRAFAQDNETAPAMGTTNSYLEALERIMILDEVPAWDPAVRSSKRWVTAAKRQLTDPSLSAALLGMSSERMLNDLTTAGFLFESLALHDLRVFAEACGAFVHHYREADGRLEVDYIVETLDGQWMGIEVKLGQHEIDKAAASLLKLATRVPQAPQALIVLTGTSFAHTREDGVHVIPLGLLGP